MQDFPGMVARYGLELAGYFQVDRPARLDLFVRINYEAYFFADEAEIQRFLEDPIASCGLLTDPVSKRRFRPTAGARPEAFEGVDFYFESDATRERFRAMPSSYGLPGHKMAAE